MTRTARNHGWAGWAKLGAGAVVAFLLGGPATVMGASKAPGVVEGGFFTPALPAAARFGPDPDRTCPSSGGIFSELPREISSAAKDVGRPPAVPDGRLCAMAETFLGWPGQESPPERVLRFAAEYFGMPQPPQQVLVAVIETDDPRILAEKLAESVGGFLKRGGLVRYGASAIRLAKEKTKVTLVLQSAAVDVDPFPRRLAPGQSAAVSGQLLGDLENPTILLSEASGKLSTPPQVPGKAFRFEVRCGDRPATLHVEVRGERGGQPQSVATFPIACGRDLPASVALSTGEAWAGDISRQERKVLEEINVERADAGLAPLAWDDQVAGVARAVAGTLADQARKGEAQAPPDIAARLKEAGVLSALVFANPAQARSGEDASYQLLRSPAHRANFMNPDTTHAGIGIATAKGPDGRERAFLIEIFIKVLPPMDVGQLRKKLAAAIAERRLIEKRGLLSSDATLEEVAQKYAEEMATARGGLPPERDDQLLASLKKDFASVHILLGGSTAPMEYAQERKALASGSRIGVGVAQGDHPTLGRNVAYVVVLVGEIREPAAKPPVKPPAKPPAAKPAAKPAPQAAPGK